MTPKTEIRYSMVYNRVFNENFSREELIKLKEDCKEFEELYKKHIKEILNLMEKHHMKKWKYKLIPIYIAKSAPYSFSDPLTLKYQESPKMMLVLLAHELLHNNFPEKMKFKNPRELHAHMEPILNKIIRDLNPDLEKELDILNKRTMALAIKNSK